MGQGALLARFDAKAARVAISFATSSAKPKGDIKICRAVLISTFADGVNFSCTDLNRVTAATVQSEIESEGSLCAPADDVQRFLGRIDGEVEMRQEGGRLHIICGSARCDLPTAKPDAFPLLEVKSAGQVFDDMPSKEIQRALRSVKHSAAPKNDAREILKSIFFDNEGDTSFVIAMCEHRGAVYDLCRKLNLPNFMISKDTLNALSSLLYGTETVTIRTDGSLAKFSAVNKDPLSVREITTSLIGGQYVNWRHVASKPSGENRFYPEADGLKKAVSAVSALQPTGKSQAVRITLNGSGVELALSENHRANAENYFACDIEGQGHVGLNPDYVLDALNQIDGEAEISFSNENETVQITSPGSPLRQFIQPRRA